MKDQHFELDKDSPHMTFRSPVDGHEKEALFKQSDIFILPSYSEGFPLSVLEAMSYGLPLIVTPVGALPEVLKEGENCFFVKPGSVSDLTRALTQLFELGSALYSMSLEEAV